MLVQCIQTSQHIIDDEQEVSGHASITCISPLRGRLYILYKQPILCSGCHVLCTLADLIYMSKHYDA